MVDVLEDRSLGHYDIGCGFEETIKRSSLSPEWQQLLCCMIINTFHGYTHNYACQTKNHPNIIEGTDLEDSETFEHVFSASNSLAPVTRYVSAYRRHVYIDEYFHQWDDEKYVSLSTMIYNNYIQALNIIEMESIAVVESMQSLDVKKEDLVQWHAEEHCYFQTLRQEPLWDVYAVAYVEKLQEWQSICAQVETDAGLFLTSIPSDYTFISLTAGNVDYYAEVSHTQKLETRRRYLEERECTLLHDLLAMEVQMNISQRWQLTDDKYVKTAKYVAMCTYHHALNNLQQLVVQRLFELHKLNLSQTAYRARTHIVKSLQARCKAIRHAVKAYNTAALTIDPPRPML
ncbi:uncharacterized protein LAESUDRAFT_755820 [Laetiporus sulphureus 93-53]|uniref:Uncharacterized protein n=1 Tax=Laetiporus sulphureus 93-53 TaxID=1314785 RepID=A0A165GGH5_9APHY|nr:uncharacterized protein LAESUDRAFT_755820 [Laetiporus sulphureus 93-53]KZT10313.1 hypothetical protein LAESUDRAFT_755820 [Laetiporus sulphureus 93-53]